MRELEETRVGVGTQGHETDLRLDAQAAVAWRGGDGFHRLCPPVSVVLDRAPPQRARRLVASIDPRLQGLETPEPGEQLLE